MSLNEIIDELILNVIVNGAECFKEASKQIVAMRKIRDAHDFATRMHGKLGHSRVNDSNAQSGRDRRTDRASTRTIVSN